MATSSRGRTVLKKAAPNERIYCMGGPLAGVTLALHDPATPTFTLKGQTGRYIHGRWYPAKGASK